MPNHYETLGVERTATQSQIKQAYYSKSKLFHPDSASSLSAKQRQQHQRQFVELKEAYDVLRRPADRKAYDEQLLSGSARYSTSGSTASARQHYYYHHHYRSASGAPPPQYDHYGQDWRTFWARASGANNMGAEEITKRNQQQWMLIARYTLIGITIVLIYHIGYLLLVLRRNRELDALVDKDEIARSFLRQREFANYRDDPEHAQQLAQILRADIDEAHRRKLATMKDKNPREIREQYRWMNAVRSVDPSKRFRLRRRAAIEEEERQKAAAKNNIDTDAAQKSSPELSSSVHTVQRPSERSI